MEDVVIVSGSRTAVGNFGGNLKSVTSVELGALVIKDVLKKAGLRPGLSENMLEYTPEPLRSQGLTELELNHYDWDNSCPSIAVDEVIMGNVLQAGQGQNPARQAMIRAGLPKEVPAVTINKICGSGLKAIAMGASSILSGQAEVIIAGGQESMSNAPMALPKARWGHRMELTGTGPVKDLLVYDGLFEIFYGYHMGITAENIVKKYSISREEQDKLSYLSHKRATDAIKGGRFKDEIVPVLIKSRKGDSLFETDERPMETTMEELSKLRSVFQKDGTVTAGNASGINDGAAAILMMTRDKAKQLGLTPMARIKGFSSGGLDPAYMGLGPVPAIRKVLSRTGMALSDIEMIELNEAFAAQAIGCMLELGMDFDVPNQRGSGISLGHPIGCTGARQTVTGIHQMSQQGLATGLVSMCIGGGMGMAMILEQP